MVVPYGSLRSGERRRLDGPSGIQRRQRHRDSAAPGRCAMHRGVGRRTDVLLFAQRPRILRIFRLRRLHQARATGSTWLPGLSVAGGLGFPTGASNVSSHGYDPYIQLPWSDEITDDWSLHGMFTVTWFTSQHTKSDLRADTVTRACARCGKQYCLSSTSATIRTTRDRCQILDGGGSVAIHEGPADRLSGRLRSEQQLSRSLLRHRLFVPPRPIIWKLIATSPFRGSFAQQVGRNLFRRFYIFVFLTWMTE